MSWSSLLLERRTIPSPEAQAIIDKFVAERGELRIIPWPEGPSQHFDRKGEPLSFSEWAILFENMDYRRVGWDEVGIYHVSTVWLGLDHGFGSGPPLIFESMVFASELSFHKERTFELETGELTIPEFAYHQDFDQRRYSTEEQALEGHRSLCEEVRLAWEGLRHADPRGG